MNSLYHKIAVASVCTALSFTLGANQEAKAATFTLTASRFLVEGTSESGGLYVDDSNSLGPSIKRDDYGEGYSATRAFYEFNIGNLSLAPDAVISSAFFNVRVRDIMNYRRYFFIDFLGYVGNGIAEASDFDAGGRLSFIDFYAYGQPEDLIRVDVTEFINGQVTNGNAFAGFGFRHSEASYGIATLDYIAELNIETEPVPEPTTIFGSALALGVGGWLKRKKSNQQSKTTSQH